MWLGGLALSREEEEEEEEEDPPRFASSRGKSDRDFKMCACVREEEEESLIVFTEKKFIVHVS